MRSNSEYHSYYTYPEVSLCLVFWEVQSKYNGKLIFSAILYTYINSMVLYNILISSSPMIPSQYFKKKKKKKKKTNMRVFYLVDLFVEFDLKNIFFYKYSISITYV